MSDTGSLTQRYLTDDEVIGVVDKFGQELRFRVRVYRGAGTTPIVVASPAINDDGLRYAPSCMTCKLANAVLSGVLAHNPLMMVYYELDDLLDGTLLSFDQVSFHYFGNKHRLTVFNPLRIACDLRTLEFYLGAEIDI